MGFSGGGSGTSSIHGSSDVALSNPTNGQTLVYDSSTSVWKNQNPAGGSSVAVQDEGVVVTAAASALNFSGSGVSATNSSGTVTVTIPSTTGTGVPGAVYFDTFFAGADDNAKMAAMNTYNAGKGAGTARPVIMFDSRQYNFSTAIGLYSGMALLGGKQSPSREYSTGTVFNWQGGSGTSLFTFPGSQAGQGYPSDGSPRDISFSFIQFQGGGSTHCIPKNDPTTSSNFAGNTLWYVQFHSCGFKSFNTVWWGWGDGAVIDGLTHFQGIVDTALCLGGSENTIFGNDTFSFMGISTDNGKAQIRSIMSKSSIGRCMITARKTGYGLSIEGGHSLVVDGLAIDAQDSDPMYGSGMQISGGDAVTITNCSFKGMATAPASGLGGAASNKGWIDITGGAQITFSGNNFYRAGTNLPATSFPLIHVAGVGAGQVKWGYNGFSGWAGAGAVLQQSSSGFITEAGDPNISISVG